jgi:hypothetical protein
VEINCHLSAPTTQRKQKGVHTSRKIFLLSGLAWRDCCTFPWHLTPSCCSSNLYLFPLPSHRFNLLVLLQFLTNITRVPSERKKRYKKPASMQANLDITNSENPKHMFHHKINTSPMEKRQCHRFWKVKAEEKPTLHRKIFVSSFIETDKKESSTLKASKHSSNPKNRILGIYSSQTDSRPHHHHF